MAWLDNFFSVVRSLFTKAQLGDNGTAGPPVKPTDPVPPPVSPPVVSSPVQVPAPPPFVDGYWRLARHVSAHPARIGGVIDPEFVVEHCTEMHPDSWADLLVAWQRAPAPGRAACANFLLGRTGEQGMVQFAPITRNASHAGGTTHGWFVVNGQKVHPNSKSVGIEIHCAGRLRNIDGVWRWGEPVKGKWTAIGAPIPDEEVDPLSGIYGFHRPTEYQLHMLSQLERDLAVTLRPLTDPNWSVIPNPPDKPPSWARSIRPSVPVVGHVHLDPTDREDPGPLLCARISVLPWQTQKSVAR